jgi:bile acid:Na+ symporter, BASS family
MSMDRLINLLAAITLIEMMVAIGLSVSIGEVLGVAKNWRLLIGAALANYLLVPAAAVALLLLFNARPLVAAGFLIAAVCPGAPFGPPFTAMAKGNVVVAIGLMVILAASSALIAPLLLRLLIPIACGNQVVDINAGKMIAILFGAQLFPLCLGLAARQWRAALADRLVKPLRRLSTLLNLATFGLILTLQFRMLAQIRPAAWAGMLALVFIAALGGWVLSAPGAGNRTAMLMATSVRNVGVAMVIATGSFAGTAAVTAATAFAIFQTILMALVAMIWGRLANLKHPGQPVAANPC